MVLVFALLFSSMGLTFTNMSIGGLNSSFMIVVDKLSKN